MELRRVFRAEPISIEQTLGHTRMGFYIPSYQRPYAWSKENIVRLLANICEGLVSLKEMEDAITFIGTFIFILDNEFVNVEPKAKNELPSGVMLVIDGQQRLTTLIMIAIALHEEIENTASKRLKPDQAGYQWMERQKAELLDRLEQLILLDNRFGEDSFRWYPRIIRAHVDQWGYRKVSAQYESPIASLIAQYCLHWNGGKSKSDQLEFEFAPSDKQAESNELEQVTKAFSVVQKRIAALAQNKVSKSEEDEEQLPDVREVVANRALAPRFFRNEVPQEVVDAIAGGSDGKKAWQNDLLILARLFMLTRYFLERIAVTQVVVSKEEYAFDMFEALNTTGAPLTAIETFRPKVINCEKLEKYQTSESAKFMKTVEEYLESHGSKDREQASHRLLIPFALFETGQKLSKHLREQRNWLRRQYDGLKALEEQREFVHGMAYVAQFLKECWPEDEKAPNYPHTLLDKLSPPERDTAFMCLDVLRAARHTITVSVLARFYGEMLQAPPTDQLRSQQQLAGVLKAIVAFFALWRASRVGTDSIDKVYRDLMAQGPGEGIPPFNRRSCRQTGFKFTVDGLRSYLREKLREKFIDTQRQWIERASEIPVYQQSVDLTRLLLLAAFHDAVPDGERPGFTVDGRAQIFPALTLEHWRERSDVEHIAPQTQTPTWSVEIYQRSRQHSLGNLTLLPREENASVSNKSWEHKHFYYRSLSSSEANLQPLLDEAAAAGIELSRPSQDLLIRGQHLPYLKALAQLPSTTVWGIEAIRARTEHLLERAWNRLAPWLDL